MGALPAFVATNGSIFSGFGGEGSRAGEGAFVGEARPKDQEEKTLEMGVGEGRTAGGSSEAEVVTGAARGGPVGEVGSSELMIDAGADMEVIDDSLAALSGRGTERRDVR